MHALHDRRVPGTRANIDHIAVSSSGGSVIDAKKYTDQILHDSRCGDPVAIGLRKFVTMPYESTVPDPAVVALTIGRTSPFEPM